MSVGNTGAWGRCFPVAADRYISVSEMHTRLSSLNLAPAKAPQGNGPARTFAIPGAFGTVGFISPLGEHFCATCNRLRLTADGSLRPCLLMDHEISIRAAIRQGTELGPFLKQAVEMKPEGHELLAISPKHPIRAMSQMGG